MGIIKKKRTTFTGGPFLINYFYDRLYISTSPIFADQRGFSHSKLTMF